MYPAPPATRIFLPSPDFLFKSYSSPHILSSADIIVARAKQPPRRGDEANDVGGKMASPRRQTIAPAPRPSLPISPRV